MKLENFLQEITESPTPVEFYLEERLHKGSLLLKEVNGEKLIFLNSNVLISGLDKRDPNFVNSFFIGFPNKLYYAQYGVEFKVIGENGKTKNPELGDCYLIDDKKVYVHEIIGDIIFLTLEKGSEDKVFRKIHSENLKETYQFVK